MQLQPTLAFSNIFLTALIVLWTWTSLAHGAAINRDISPVRRNPNEETPATFDLLTGNVLITRGIPATKPRGLPETDTRKPVDDWYTLATRDVGNGDETDLHKRWYTLVEIADAQESD